MKSSTKYLIFTYVCIFSALPFMGSPVALILGAAGIVFAFLGISENEKEQR